MSRPAYERPLWTCPRCKNAFVTRNLWHSCGTWSLDSHFEGRPDARATFDALTTAIEAIGPVRIVVSKTRIAFMTRVRFAAVTPRKRSLRGHLWLADRPASPLFLRSTELYPRAWINEFALEGPEAITPEFIGYLQDAYAVGQQMHLRPKAQTLGEGPT